MPGTRGDIATDSARIKRVTGDIMINFVSGNLTPSDKMDKFIEKQKPPKLTLKEIT